MAILYNDFKMFTDAVPSKIDTLEIDAIISRETDLDSEVSQNPVEDGFPVADHVTRQPLRLSMECVFTPTPVTQYGQGADTSKLATTARELQRIYTEAEPITIKTPDAIYKNMVMTHAPLTRSSEKGYAYIIQLDFEHVRIVKQKTEEVPEGGTSADASGKAGATEKDMGAASQQDIGTGMTVVDNSPVVSLDTMNTDKMANGNINTQKELTAYTAAASLAICYLTT